MVGFLSRLERRQQRFSLFDEPLTQTTGQGKKNLGQVFFIELSQVI